MFSVIIWGAVFLGFMAAIMVLWFIHDRKNAPPGFDEACSKIDDELNKEGK